MPLIKLNLLSIFSGILILENLEKLKKRNVYNYFAISMIIFVNIYYEYIKRILIFSSVALPGLIRYKIKQKTNKKKKK